MPLYDFRCNSCGTLFERFARMENDSERACECGGSADRVVTTRYTVGSDACDYVENNLGHDPVRVTSWKQLERMAADRKLTPRHKGWW